MSSLREIGRDQFGDGTTIDGNRLERWLAGVVRRFNALGKGDRTRRWVRNTYVGGYIGAHRVVAAQRKAPWMGVANRSGELIGTVTGAPFNYYRTKGMRNDYIPVEDGNPAHNVLAWTTSLAFVKPAIITEVQVSLLTDSDYPNTFQYGAGFPAALVNTPSDDFAIELLVDNPFTPEDRRLADVELHRIRFMLDAWKVSPDGPRAPTADMTPAHPRNLDGVHIVLPRLNVPIPAQSRARLAFVLPQYNTGTYTSGWLSNPWRSQYYSWKLSVLESVEE